MSRNGQISVESVSVSSTACLALVREAVRRQEKLCKAEKEMVFTATAAVEPGQGQAAPNATLNTLLGKPVTITGKILPDESLLRDLNIGEGGVLVLRASPMMINVDISGIPVVEGMIQEATVPIKIFPDERVARLMDSLSARSGMNKQQLRLKAGRKFVVETDSLTLHEAGILASTKLVLVRR